jgi:hypothetical protein
VISIPAMPVDVAGFFGCEGEGSVRKTRLLDQQAPAKTLRVVTDGRLVVDIAREVVVATGWAGPPITPACGPR